MAVLALSGCGGGSKEAAPTATIPIATEAPVVVTSTATVASTAVTSTVATVTTTTVAPYTTVPVLIRYTAKSAGEQEVIDAMKVLLPIQYRVALNLDVDETVIRAGYTGLAVADVRADVEAANREGKYSTAGQIDRYVVIGVRRVTPTLAAARACHANDARTYRRTGDASTLIDDKTVSRIFDYQLARTELGWRLEGVAVRTKKDGDQLCAS